MLKEIALITIHGMGKEKGDKDSELKEKLRQSMNRDVFNKISFQSIDYAAELQGPQTELWNKIKAEPSNDIDYTRTRSFLLSWLGDATSIEHSRSKDNKKYVQIQEVVQAGLKEAYDEMGQGKSVVIIAQSLGCQVISNYIWDAQHGLGIFKKQKEGSKDLQSFYEMKSLRQLITTGCNIPLFVAGLDKRVCFDKKKLGKGFKWDNYYDPDDVLGWPLRQLDNSYKLAVRDHHINAGGFWGSWNPGSHSAYWTDNDVVSELAAKIRGLL